MKHVRERQINEYSRKIIACLSEQEVKPIPAACFSCQFCGMSNIKLVQGTLEIRTFHIISCVNELIKWDINSYLDPETQKYAAEHPETVPPPPCGAGFGICKGKSFMKKGWV